MFDAQQLLGSLLGGSILGRGSKAVGKTLGGNKAIVGVGLLGVAMAAYEHYQSTQTRPAAPTGAAPPSPTAQPAMPPPPPAVDRQAHALLLIRAMVAAANADGHIDAAERSVILERALRAGLDAEGQQALLRELEQPLSVQALTATAPPQLGPELYLAARYAINVDHGSERDFLDRLSAGLGLSGSVRAGLDAQFVATQG